MERLTKNDLNKVCYDPWEICGMDEHCIKGCNDEGGCTKGCHVLKIHRKLAEYEDAEEQGLLIRLPCKVGTILYYPHCAWIEHKIQWLVNDLTVENVDHALRFNGYIGKTVFFTREEAEAKLAEMQKG